MTYLNPHAHHTSVTSSQSWTWVTIPKPARSLSREVRKRLLYLRWHQTHEQNVSCTCRHFGINRPPSMPDVLGTCSRAPRGWEIGLIWSTAQAQAVLAQREAHPG